MNAIGPGSLVTLNYRLCGPDGAELISTFGARPATLSIGTGQLAPALEAQLIGRAEGHRAVCDLPAGAAFGPRNPALLQRVNRRLLRRSGDPQADYQPGDVVGFPAPAGQAGYAGVVQASGVDWVLFDFNHPLAGQAMSFEVEVIGVIAQAA